MTVRHTPTSAPVHLNHQLRRKNWPINHTLGQTPNKVVGCQDKLFQSRLAHVRCRGFVGKYLPPVVVCLNSVMFNFSFSSLGDRLLNLMAAFVAFH